MSSSLTNSKMSILFVCLGNICRSPTAEGIFKKLSKTAQISDSVLVDSAGTSNYNLNQPPDQRAQKIALENNIDLSALRARQINKNDFEIFDYIIAMDRKNKNKLLDICPYEKQNRIHLLLDFYSSSNQLDVPDPFFGDIDGFKTVFNLIEEASKELIKNLSIKIT